MDEKLIPGFELNKFETICHFEYIKFLLEVKNKFEKSARYGVTTGSDAYMFITLTLDLSVLLFETIELYELMVSGSSDELKSDSFYGDLETIRNNIHTFYKKGGYSDKSDDIVLDKLEEYKMKNKDILYPLRSDISLAFRISNKNRLLIGGDYFINHCIYETNGSWSGEKFRDYGTFLTSNIKGLAQVHDETVYNLPNIKPNYQLPVIELFDYKSANLFSRSKISNHLLFRLMLILHNISYVILVVDELIHKDTLGDELWLCFFTKFLAIKYDESFDNLASMVKFSQDNDRTMIKEWLNQNSLKINMDSTRMFAQKLRNTIHYKTTKIDISNTINTSRDYVKALYLYNTNLNSLDDYKAEYDKIYTKLKLLQSAIQNLFNLNKKY